MSAENASEEGDLLSQRLCLRVAAESDPSSLIRILQFFQHLNAVPNRVWAECATNGVIHIEIHITNVSPERLRVIAAKIGQMPMILNAYWHRA